MNNIFKPLNEEAVIHRRRRNLPHWQQSGCTYFVSFRTADSLPQSKLAEINEQKEVWLRCHPEPWSEKDWDEYNRRFTEKIQTWLDAGYGACVLRQPELAGIVGSALRHFDLDRYVLDEFVVMPNHVHALLKPLGDHSLERILHSWKSFTANKINGYLGTTGTFWMDESFDHAVRSWAQLEHFRKYIRENPLKAGLQNGAFVHGQGKNGIVDNVTQASSL
jgi:REP element-mobilizing transposase RayT